MIIRIPHNGLFDAKMKTLKSFELEQTEFFKLGLFKLFEKIQIIVYMSICSTHLKLKKILTYVSLTGF